MTTTLFIVHVLVFTAVFVHVVASKSTCSNLYRLPYSTVELRVSESIL